MLCVKCHRKTRKRSFLAPHTGPQSPHTIGMYLYELPCLWGDLHMSYMMKNISILARFGLSCLFEHKCCRETRKWSFLAPHTGPQPPHTIGMYLYELPCLWGGLHMSYMIKNRLFWPVLTIFVYFKHEMLSENSKLVVSCPPCKPTLPPHSWGDFPSIAMLAGGLIRSIHDKKQVIFASNWA